MDRRIKVIELADEILSLTGRSGASHFFWDFHPEAYAAFEGHGVAVMDRIAPGSDAVDDAIFDAVTSDVLDGRRVTIDAGAVLQHAMAMYHLDVVPGAMGLHIVDPRAPFETLCAGCSVPYDVVFAAHNYTGIYGLRPKGHPTAMTVVVHVRDGVDAASYYPFRIVPVRLREFRGATLTISLDVAQQVDTEAHAYERDRANTTT